MSKTLKILLYAALSIIALVVLAITVTISLVNPNKYKGQITELASSQLQRKVEIGGELEWSIFPLGVSINKLSIANDPIFKEQYLLTSEEAVISLELIPLLWKSYIIDYLYLKNTELNLAKNDKGYTNWQSIGQNTDSTKLNKTQSNIKNSNSSDKKDNNDAIIPESVQNFSIEEIQIDNANIKWREPNEKIDIEHINLKASDFSLADGSTFNITSSFKTSIKSKELTVYNDIDSDISFQNNFNQLHLKLNKLHIELGGDAYPRHPFLNLRSDLSVDIENNRFKLLDFKGDINNLKINGDLKGELNENNRELEGNIKIIKSTLSDFLHKLNYEHLEHNYQTISGELNFHTNNKIIDISPLELKLDSDYLKGKININARNKPYIITSDIQANSFDINKLVPEKSRTSKDLDAKLAKNSDANSNTKSNDNNPIFSDDLKSILNLIQLTANTKFNNLKLFKTQLKNLNNNLTIQKGVIKSNTNFEVFSGKATSTNSINLNGKLPKFNGSFNFNNFQLAELLKAQLGSSAASGATDLKLDFNSSGNTGDAVISNLDGKFNLNINSGSIAGVDVNKFINLLSTEFSLNPLDSIDTATSTLLFAASFLDTIVSGATGDNFSTPIASLTATGSINNGILSNNDMRLVSTKAIINGAGTINLPNQSINYTLKLHDLHDSDADDNILIPVHITGSLSNPDYNIGTPSGNLIKSSLKSFGKVLGKIPGFKKLEKIEELPNKVIEQLLNF